LKDGSSRQRHRAAARLRGTAISIRKFSAKPITLDMMAKGGSMNDRMSTFLKIAGRVPLERGHFRRYRFG
jgi:pilus assembly protein CpaF